MWLGWRHALCKLQHTHRQLSESTKHVSKPQLQAGRVPRIHMSASSHATTWTQLMLPQPSLILLSMLPRRAGKQTTAQDSFERHFWINIPCGACMWGLQSLNRRCHTVLPCASGCMLEYRQQWPPSRLHPALRHVPRAELHMQSTHTMCAVLHACCVLWAYDEGTPTAAHVFKACICS